MTDLDTWEQRLDRATQEARVQQEARDAEHESRHGHDYVWVERRHGYKGRRVCRRCYYEGVI